MLLTSLHLKHFSRNTQVLNVEGSSNYLYVLYGLQFTIHLKKILTFPEQGKIHHYTKIGSDPFIEYLSGLLSVDF